MKRLGFIGMGNMASAILLGALKAGYLHAEQVYAYDSDQKKVEVMGRETGIHPASTAEELVAQSDIVLMAVKPYNIEEVVKEHYDAFKGKAIISIALGWTYEKYREILPQETRVAFVMPNTPCMVGEGMALLEETNNLAPEELEFTKGLFESIGKLLPVKTSLMNVGGTLSGCGPAFLYVIMEALADGAVFHGLPRDMAYTLVSQMVLGSGKMLAESGLHPGKLKDNVCSPAGSTIRGVRALEDGNIRATLIDAIDRAVMMK